MKKLLLLCCAFVVGFSTATAQEQKDKLDEGIRESPLTKNYLDMLQVCVYDSRGFRGDKDYPDYEYMLDNVTCEITSNGKTEIFNNVDSKGSGVIAIEKLYDSEELYFVFKRPGYKTLKVKWKNTNPRAIIEVFMKSESDKPYKSPYKVYDLGTFEIAVP